MREPRYQVSLASLGACLPYLVLAGSSGPIDNNTPRKSILRSRQALQDALNILHGFASFKGEKIETHVRVASHEDKDYLDLCDKRWRAVELDETGWRIVDTPPVRFRRPKGVTELAENEWRIASTNETHHHLRP